MIVGPWLGAALVGAAMISEFGTFNLLVMSYSRLPVAMAEATTLAQNLYGHKLKPSTLAYAILVSASGGTGASGAEL